MIRSNVSNFVSCLFVLCLRNLWLTRGHKDIFRSLIVFNFTLRSIIHFEQCKFYSRFINYCYNGNNPIFFNWGIGKQSVVYPYDGYIFKKPWYIKCMEESQICYAKWKKSGLQVINYMIPFIWYSGKGKIIKTETDQRQPVTGNRGEVD